MTDPVLGIRALRCSIGSTELLGGINLAVETGRNCALFGPSGGGKSTLLRLMNRLQDPSGGELTLDGISYAQIPVLELRRKVVLIHQQPAMFPGTVRDNLRAPFRFARNTPPGDEVFLPLLTACDLPAGILDRSAAELSIGQQQRVSVIRGLGLRPRVLLLDEPTAPLDIRSSEHLMQEITRACAETGTTFIIACHDLDIVRRHTAWACFLEQGQMVEQGESRKILESPASTALEAFLARRSQ